jgi:uncharacterized protein (TIGR03382 family)
MRRAWLLALLLAPALAAAQAAPTPGQVTFDSEFINSVECQSGGGDVSLRWDAAAVPTDANSEYRVYASNEPHTSPDCHTTSSGVGGTRVAGEVVRTGGGTVIATNQTGGPVDYPTSDFIAKAGKSCTTTTSETIYVCVQGTAAGGGDPKFGFAVGTLTIDLVAPVAVTGVRASGGENALEVAWSDPADPDTGRYRVSAQSVIDPQNLATSAVDPRDTRPHLSDIVAGGSHRVEGLVQDVVYKVIVYAFDQADNQSDPSNLASASPVEVRDFWEAYRDAGGREQGGCAGGPAGLASLAVAAGTALLLRRRK